VTSRFLLDTNVVSEVRRSRPDPAVAAWFDGLGQAELFLSVLTLGEIGLGIHRLRRRDAAQADVLDRWLAKLRRVYADRLLPVTDEVAAPGRRSTRLGRCRSWTGCSLPRRWSMTPCW